MRAVIYRGWAQNQDDNKGWVYGSLIIYSDKSVAIYEADTGLTWPVIDESVGEGCGLTDKNGTEIFEGDIVKGLAHGDVNEEIVAPVCWDEWGAWSLIEFNDEQEVIGNIYENPELLTKEGTQQ